MENHLDCMDKHGLGCSDKRGFQGKLDDGKADLASAGIGSDAVVDLETLESWCQNICKRAKSKEGSLLIQSHIKNATPAEMFVVATPFLYNEVALLQDTFANYLMPDLLCKMADAVPKLSGKQHDQLQFLFDQMMKAVVKNAGFLARRSRSVHALCNLLENLSCMTISKCLVEALIPSLDKLAHHQNGKKVVEVLIRHKEKFGCQEALSSTFMSGASPRIAKEKKVFDELRQQWATA